MPKPPAGPQLHGCTICGQTQEGHTRWVRHLSNDHSDLKPALGSQPRRCVPPFCPGLNGVEVLKTRLIEAIQKEIAPL